MEEEEGTLLPAAAADAPPLQPVHVAKIKAASKGKAWEGSEDSTAGLPGTRFPAVRPKGPTAPYKMPAAPQLHPPPPKPAALGPRVVAPPPPGHWLRPAAPLVAPPQHLIVKATGRPSRAPSAPETPPPKHLLVPPPQEPVARPKRERGNRGGGANARWWTARHQAEREGRLSEFLRSNPKPVSAQERMEM